MDDDLEKQAQELQREAGNLVNKGIESVVDSLELLHNMLINILVTQRDPARGERIAKAMKHLTDAMNALREQ